MIPRCSVGGCHEIAAWTYWTLWMQAVDRPAYLCEAHAVEHKQWCHTRYVVDVEFRRVSDGPSTLYPPSGPTVKP